MKVLIIPNFTKDGILDATNEVIKKLISINCSPMLTDEYEEYFNNNNIIFSSFYNLLKNCDIIISIGGDGTLIHSAKHAVMYNKPLLGINLGRLGYLTGLEISELNALDKLVTNQYTYDKRGFLNIIHQTQDQEIYYKAFNDIVISNGNISKIINLDVYLDNNFSASYFADGIIIATPTGSTAYSLSAGGPIIAPNIECISFTPICPHTLFSRTIIFEKSSILTIKQNENNLHPVFITIDGEMGKELRQDDKVIVSFGDIYVNLIKLDDHTFFDVLKKKFFDKK